MSDSFLILGYPVSRFFLFLFLFLFQKTKRPGLTAQTGPPEGELRTFRSADVTAARLVPLFDPGVLRLDAALHSSATTLTNVSRQSN